MSPSGHRKRGQSDQKGGNACPQMHAGVRRKPDLLRAYAIAGPAIDKLPVTKVHCSFPVRFFRFHRLSIASLPRSPGPFRFRDRFAGCIPGRSSGNLRATAASDSLSGAVLVRLPRDPAAGKAVSREDEIAVNLRSGTIALVVFLGTGLVLSTLVPAQQQSVPDAPTPQAPTALPGRTHYSWNWRRQWLFQLNELAKCRYATAGPNRNCSATPAS